MMLLTPFDLDIKRWRVL